MEKNKFFQKALLLISIASILCNTAFGMGVTAHAESKNQVTATTATTVQQGDFGTCYVYIDSLENVSTLNVSVHYDSSKISIYGTYNLVPANMYDCSVNDEALRYTYVFDRNDAAERVNLFYFDYSVTSDAEAGETCFDIVVEDAYDAQHAPLAISGSRTDFSITEKAISQTAYVYGTSSLSTSVEQEFTLSYHLSTTDIASGSVTLTYDSELFEVVEVEEKGFLNNKTTDINTTLKGCVYISFAGTQYSSSTELISITFRTLKNQPTTSTFILSATGLYDLERNGISCDGHTCFVSVEYDDSYIGDAPKMSLSATCSEDGDQLILQVLLEENSRLGAGDFTIRFDRECYTYVASQKGFAPTSFDINDKEVDEGILEFHVISTSDIVDKQTVLTVIFDIDSSCGFKETTFDLSGSAIADSLTNPIRLNCVDATYAVRCEHKNYGGNGACPHCGTVVYDSTTGRVTLFPFPEGSMVAFIAAYQDGQMIRIIPGTVGSNNLKLSPGKADKLKIFYLGTDYQPITDAVTFNLNSST